MDSFYSLPVHDGKISFFLLSTNGRRYRRVIRSHRWNSIAAVARRKVAESTAESNRASPSVHQGKSHCFPHCLHGATAERLCLTISIDLFSTDHIPGQAVTQTIEGAEPEPTQNQVIIFDISLAILLLFTLLTTFSFITYVPSIVDGVGEEPHLHHSRISIAPRPKTPTYKGKQPLRTRYSCFC